MEICNAEKVEIVRGASERTVSSRNGSYTRGTGSLGRPGGEVEPTSGPKPGLQIVKVGMRVPERNEALTSNPPLLPSEPSPSQFPTPPGSRGFGLGEERKASNWPLAD